MEPEHILLRKFLDNKCTPSEAEQVLNLLTKKEGSEIYEAQFNDDIQFIEQGNTFNENEDVRSAFIYQQIQNRINDSNESATLPVTRKISRNWLNIAAAILIPLLLTNVIFWYFLNSRDKETVWQEVYVPKGEKLQVMFQDGTKVWLNSDTKLKYPVEFKENEREVKLEGEAYFVVKKDIEKPFYVHLIGLSLKVTGTSFNVKAYGNEPTMTTNLDEGNVSLLTIQQNIEVEHKLIPGQQASFSKNNSKIRIASSAIGKNSQWKDNKIIFKNTHLNEVIKILERWYNVKFELADPAIANYTYTISFNNEPLQKCAFLAWRK
ncbi:MAG: DUF4974 domain-containing protein [Bacteroidales bacterium]|nr:DUF4974 domain-containing protein [Bacteroidales bacterium]